VRIEVSSALEVTYPKPGKPQVRPANILDDLRSRDFTANAMALSLNEGSYGLLMDPLNGVADIENHELRLVNNYGFYEDPVRMIRAMRFSARLGWRLEERTQARYETGKSEGYISAMSAFERGYELEQIALEDDPLRVVRRLESEGWMKVLCPAWTAAKANEGELERLKDVMAQLQIRGIHADPSAAQFPLITAKMQSKDVASLKRSFPLRGLVREIDELESEGKRFAADLSSKQAGTPSAAWKMIMAARPEAVLWAGYAVKSAAVQNKFKAFYTDWPQARQKIPYQMMQEMRITPELPEYDELVEKLFFELMDGKLNTPEEMKAFLEPYSPPAPPPPVNLRRARSRKDGRAKPRRKAETEGLDETAIAAATVLETGDEIAAGGEVISGVAAKGRAGKAKAVQVPVPADAAAKAVEAPGIKAGKNAKAVPAKAASVKKTPAKVASTKAAVARPVAKSAAPPKKPGAKKPAKAPQKKAPPKKAIKAAAKSKPAAKKATHKTPQKPAAKKTVKPAAKKAIKPAAKRGAKSTSKKKH
jgi:hypothetical protein